MTVLHFHWLWLVLFLISPSIGFFGHHMYDEGKVRNVDFIRPQTFFYLSAIFGLLLLRRYKPISEAVIQKVRMQKVLTSPVLP